MDIKKVTLFGFRCLKLSNDKLEAVVTLSVGPRIISLAAKGGKNLLYVDAAAKGAKGGDGFRVYGGHRLWYAPELEETTYFPDNAPVKYGADGDGVTFYTARDTNGIRKYFRVLLDGESVKIDHFAENGANEEKELALWGLTMFDGGLAVAPLSDADNGYMSNSTLSLWKYGRMNDKRVYWGDRFITLKRDAKAKSAFKFGLSVDKGWAAIFLKNCLAVKRFDFVRGVPYANGYSNFECYTCDKFTEIESLSPLLTLRPGEIAKHSERISVYANVPCPGAKDEDGIGDMLLKHGIKDA